MSKKTLFADTVLRKDGDQLYLMNKQEGGFRAWATPVFSEQAVLDTFNVRLGEWSRDEYGAFCPVICIPRSEQPTLHDVPPMVPDGITAEGIRALDNSQPASFGVGTSVSEIRSLRSPVAQAMGKALYEDGVLAEHCFQPGTLSPGLQQFIDSHPGVRVGMGPGPFLVALMPDGTAYALDADGTVFAEDELSES